jgi:hypothetical protein
VPAGDTLFGIGRPGRSARRLTDIATVMPAVAEPDDRPPACSACSCNDLVSGVVDFLADVWDTIGRAQFEPGECMLAIDEIFMPAVLRGIRHCPDCLQLLPDLPDSSLPHPLRCPVRVRRLSN